MDTDDENDLRSLMDTVEATIIQAGIDDPGPPGRNSFRPFIFFGLKIPNIHRAGLYLHLVIVSLQYFFFFNTKIMLGHALEIAFKEGDTTFDNDFVYPLLLTGAYLILPFIVYFCDRQMIRRYYLVVFYLVMAFISSCLLLSLLLLEKFEKTINYNSSNFTNTTNSIPALNELYYISEGILGISSFVLFSISYALCDTFTIAFGLDILHGTNLETLFLYFPLYYISRNVGASFAYFFYIKDFEAYRHIHCSITTFSIIIALFLLFMGRICGYFKDSAKVANNFSFTKSFKLIFSALKLKFIQGKKKKIKSLMLYVSMKNNNPNPNIQVDRTIAMLKINLIFIILIPLLGSYQILYHLFPDQGYPLSFLPIPISKENSKYYCNEQKYIQTYFIVNTLTIVVFAIIFEFFFNDIVFNVVRQDLPCWIRCIPRKLNIIKINCLYEMRKKLHAYLTLVDPILKRVFWGLPFGLLSVVCALLVDILRIKFTVILNCTDHDDIFVGSHVPLIAQVPQYIFSGVQETISIIGLLQYVYYLCSKHFQNSLKGFFFSLFFFYFGVASFLANIFSYIFYKICHVQCKSDQINITNHTAFVYHKNQSNLIREYPKPSNSYCLVFNSDCNVEQPNSWAIWVIVIILYLVMITLFCLFSHHKHWRRVRDLRDHELSWSGVD